jgi:NADH-quinone oxidoreductase subunit B
VDVICRVWSPTGRITVDLCAGSTGMATGRCTCWMACCALEFDAAARFAAVPLPTLDDRAQVAVVISGTVTDRLAPAVAAIVDGCEQLAGRRPLVISFGACASSGGPYWDSYAVTKGIDQLVAVDAYVAGCPPPPEALSAVLDEVAGRVAS